ncbi:hypothetical protein [Dasania marina]|uniref:hypothetical protein n=1 Tax=Dasania marina TaxID=471499 RepID=UPI0030D8BCB4|tara:strand:- start:36518 stop:37045 length:528 start_codon:yes stop_codon:yes gene_type:complete
MSKDDDEEKTLDPITEIERLTAQIRWNKRVIVAVLAISVICFSVLSSSAGYFYTQLKALNKTPASPLQLQLTRLDEDITSLRSYLNTESRAIAAYHLRINLLQQEYQAANSSQRIALFRSREADYQQLITEILSGSQELASMNTGSRRWLEAYEQRLQRLVASSKKRAQAWTDTP